MVAFVKVVVVLFGFAVESVEIIHRVVLPDECGGEAVVFDKVSRVVLCEDKALSVGVARCFVIDAVLVFWVHPRSVDEGVAVDAIVEAEIAAVASGREQEEVDFAVICEAVVLSQEASVVDGAEKNAQKKMGKWWRAVIAYCFLIVTSIWGMVFRCLLHRSLCRCFRGCVSRASNSPLFSPIARA